MPAHPRDWRELTYFLLLLLLLILLVVIAHGGSKQGIKYTKIKEKCAAAAATREDGSARQGPSLGR